MIISTVTTGTLNIIGNEIQNCSTDGIDINHTSRAYSNSIITVGGGLIQNNTIDNCTGSGMYFSTDISNDIDAGVVIGNATINYNRITSCSAGIYLTNFSNTTIERNMIVNNTGEGTGVNITAGSDYNEIHTNCFIGNEPQAWDNGTNNNWTGNYWSPPPGGPGNYTILGNAGSEDSNPLDACPLGKAPPTITSFAPPSPVNDTICTWRTFNVTVNQPVNVSWYLNNSLLFINETVTEANCTLHATWPGEHNVSAIATNQNGTDMQTWIWNVTGLTSVTIPTATGTGNATITTSSGYFCDIPVALKASDFPSLPESSITFFHGFFNLSICGLNTTNPETITINITFPSAIPTDAEFWKYNTSNGTWYRYEFGDNDGDNVISITITDNGPGDHNPANGTITDPNGIGWRLPVPTLSPLGMLALIGVLSTIAALTINQKKEAITSYLFLFSSYL